MSIRNAILGLLSAGPLHGYELRAACGGELLRGDSLNIGWSLGHVLAEESQHLGQVAYIRGMIKGFNG